jgi:hypothetical protein
LTVAVWSERVEPVTLNEVSDSLIRRLKTVLQTDTLPNSP